MYFCPDTLMLVSLSFFQSHSIYTFSSLYFLTELIFFFKLEVQTEKGCQDQLIQVQLIQVQLTPPGDQMQCESENPESLLLGFYLF